MHGNDANNHQSNQILYAVGKNENSISSFIITVIYSYLIHITEIFLLYLRNK